MASSDDDPQTGRRVRYMRTGRLEAFSDGVLAIAITLLVLEISVPENSEHRLLAAFLEQWPSFLAYVVSFATIGVAWLGHSAITDYLDHGDVLLARINLLFLMVVSFLPFPTRLLAENIHEEGAERVAATVYGLNLALVSVLLWALWSYALGAGL